MSTACKNVIIGLVMVCVAVSGMSLVAAGAASFCDPEPFFSVYGPGHADISTKKSQLSLSVVPYYQYARNAKNGSNAKVPLGDRLGHINMLGLLINDDPSPFAHKFGETGHDNDSTLHEAYSALKSYDTTDTDHDFSMFLGSTYEPLDVADVRQGWGKYQTTTQFARIGARGSIEYSFYNGVSIAVRGGIAEYSIKTPIYLANPTYDLASSGWVNGAFQTSPSGYLVLIQNKLMSQARQKEIGTELGIDFGAVKDTGVEDVFVEVAWRKGFSMKDKEGDHVLTMTPLIAISAVLPTAERKDITKLFDISLGNDGFYGFSGQAELSFDFPGMLCVGFGASGTVFTEDAIGKQFTPTSEYQSGVYPWQATVTKRPGALWKTYATVRSHNFIDFLSCFVTYMYVSHEADTITVSGANKADFLGAKLAVDSRYTAQMVHLGFEYEVTPSLRFGIGIQSVFAGMQVWKTTTLAASVAMVF